MDHPAKTDFAWLIETDGPHYLQVETIGHSSLFRWTRDADKALRFAREADAAAALDGLRVIEPDLFKFPTHQTIKPVEHGWTETRAEYVPQTYQEAQEASFHEALP
jgi:hypothetical protein